MKKETDKKKIKKIIIISIIAVLIITVITGACLIIRSRNTYKIGYRASSNNFYIKDNSLYYIEPKKNESILLTDDLFTSAGAELSETVISYCEKVSEDGKYVFYPSEINAETTVFTLNCYQVKSSKSDPVVNFVTNFAAATDGKSILALTETGELVYSDLKDSKTLSHNVSDYYSSEDCKSVVIQTEDNELLYMTSDGTEKKLDTEITYIEKITDNLDIICYIKDSAFYYIKDFGNTQKIADNAYDVETITDDGYVYYTVLNGTESLTMMDFVDDPEGLAESDEKIYEGTAEASTDERIEAGLRCWTRDQLKAMTYENASRNLCVYDGKESKTICESFDESYATADNSIVYSGYSYSETEKMSIYDFVDNLDKEGNFREKIYSGEEIDNDTLSACQFFDEYESHICNDDKEFFYLSGLTATKIECGNAEYFYIAEDESAVYALSDLDEEANSGDLYKVTIKDGKPESTELYETNVADFGLYQGNDIFYLKNYNTTDETFDTYVNKEKRTSGIKSYYLASNGDIYTFKVNSSEGAVTYKVFRNDEDGNMVALSQEASDFTIADDGDFICTENYDSETQTFDIVINNGKSDKTLDSGVTLLITSKNTKYGSVYTTSSND